MTTIAPPKLAEAMSRLPTDEIDRAFALGAAVARVMALREIRSIDKLVFELVAEASAGPDAHCWYSIAIIARRLGVSEGVARGALKRLAGSGLIVVAHDWPLGWPHSVPVVLASDFDEAERLRALEAEHPATRPMPRDRS